MQYSTQAATNPLYQHFVPSDHLNELEAKGFNVLIDLANDTKKIAQVFPLMNQSTENEPPDFPGSMPSTLGRSPHEQHQSRVHSPINSGSEHFNHNWTAHLAKPKTSLRPGDQNGPTQQHHPRSGSFNVSCAWNPDNFTENRIMQSNKSNSNSQPMVSSPREKAPLSAFLSVQPTQPFRTHSAEMLTPQMDTEELRRASFDVAGGYRRPGTGRKLPSTERFENPNSSQQQVSPRYDVPQIVAPGEESPPPAAMRNKQRRASFLPRANAIEGSLIQPRKQVSTPLPENTRIYDRGHVYSRSWNAEYLIGNEQDGYQARDYAKELRVEDPRRYYQSNNRNPQPPPPAPSHDPLPTLMLVPPIASFPRHAKSFDASRPNDLLHPDRSQYHERRSFSEHTQYNQPSLDIQKPQSKEEVSRQCQTLWHEREVLESIPLQTSIELSDDGPSAASTSFESNTESVAQVPESRRNSIFLEPPSHRRLSNAEVKRQKYKNLMLNRITQKSHPENSSIDSNGSDSTSGNTKLGSSFDSAELPLSKTSRRDSRRRSMMHLTRRVSTNLQKKIANRTFSVKYVPTRTLTRPALNYGASYELQRDYSVDTKSDSLFRDFARVDPRYETPQTSSAIEYPAGFRPAARRRSSHMMQAMAQYRSADNNDYNTTSSVPVPAKPTCRGYYSPSRHPL